MGSKQEKEPRPDSGRKGNEVRRLMPPGYVFSAVEVFRLAFCSFYFWFVIGSVGVVCCFWKSNVQFNDHPKPRPATMLSSKQRPHLSTFPCGLFFPSLPILLGKTKINKHNNVHKERVARLTNVECGF